MQDFRIGVLTPKNIPREKGPQFLSHDGRYLCCLTPGIEYPQGEPFRASYFEIGSGGYIFPCEPGYVPHTDVFVIDGDGELWRQTSDETIFGRTIKRAQYYCDPLWELRELKEIMGEKESAG